MSNFTQSCLPSNPDISGIGVRTAVYAQNLLSFVPAFFALHDKKVTPLELDSLEMQSTTILITAFAILVSVIVQALKRGLTNYHAAIILNLSWMNNTNLFIYFLLYAFHHRYELPTQEAKHIGNRFALPSFLAESGATKKAWKNPVFIIGSVHLSLMSAIGVWLWKRPVSFGDSKSCTLDVSLVVVGRTVPIGSQALRQWSLLAYSLLLTPALNLTVPIVFFALPVWLYGRFMPFKLNRETGIRLTRAGLVMLAVIDILLLADTEVAISKNQHLTADGDTEWTFGQTLAILLLLIPLRDIGETLLERRPKKLGEKILAAAEKGQFHIVRDAIISGASETAIGPAIVRAIKYRHWEVVEFLIGNIASSMSAICLLLDDAIASGDLMVSPDALYSAAATRQVRTVGLLSKLKDVLNAASVDGWTALHFAAQNGQAEAARLLVELGAHLNATDTHCQTALHLAAKQGKIEVVKLLAGFRADTRALDEHGRTPLEIAAREGQIEVVSFLARPGADVNGRAEKGQALFVKLVVDCGADAKGIDEIGPTLLCSAAWNRHVKAIKLLAEINADMNSRDVHSWTPLHNAAYGNHADVVKLLVELGADVNATDNGGRTAFRMATSEFRQSKKTEVIKLLGELGADLNMRDRQGGCVLHEAVDDQNIELIKLLAELGADMNIGTQLEGRTALHKAVYFGNAEMIELLAEHGADLNAKNQRGQTPLYYAAEKGSIKVVKLLVGLGADISVRDNSGQTVLDVIQKFGEPIRGDLEQALTGRAYVKANRTS